MNFPPKIERQIINGRELVCIASPGDLTFPLADEVLERPFEFFDKISTDSDSTESASTEPSEENFVKTQDPNPAGYGS